jgi:hypothetical protein
VVYFKNIISPITFCSFQKSELALRSIALPRSDYFVFAQVMHYSHGFTMIEVVRLAGLLQFNHGAVIQRISGTVGVAARG